ncbi:hypothetical protein Tco_0944113, partial [Tanacetum coccineum]
MDGCDSLSTPMATAKLYADLHGTLTDQTKYHSMTEGLMYLTASRPDIASATFVYADHAGYHDDCKSTSGGIQFLGEKLVSWSSKKQDCTAMSTAEAEYVSLSACCAQVIWMRTQLLDYGYHFNKITMYCDSKSVIAIPCNPVRHSRTKHINIYYHFIKEHVERGTVELYFVRTEYQLVDLFTKALPKGRFEYLVHRIVIMKYLVKISKKARILELKRRHLKITVLTSNTPYPSRKIRRINRLTKKEITMAEPNAYIFVTQNNFLADDKGRMVEKSFLEIQGTFLEKIRDNTFNGISGEKAFKHIDNFLKVVGPLKIKGLSEWFKKYYIGSVTTWENLVEKFIKKIYQLFDDNEEMESDEDDDPDDIA